LCHKTRKASSGRLFQCTMSNTQCSRKKGVSVRSLRFRTKTQRESCLISAKRLNSCIRWLQAIRALVALVVYNYVRFTLNEALLNSMFACLSPACRQTGQTGCSTFTHSRIQALKHCLQPPSLNLNLNPSIPGLPLRCIIACYWVVGALAFGANTVG